MRTRGYTKPEEKMLFSRRCHRDINSPARWPLRPTTLSFFVFFLICWFRTAAGFKPGKPHGALFVPVSSCIRIVVPDVAPDSFVPLCRGGSIDAQEAFPATLAALFLTPNATLVIFHYRQYTCSQCRFCCRFLCGSFRPH